ncbi:zinc ribbon domain-containing protein [Cytobacillus massiliigabonensis]|uniref:zinc ribbon domain-containing protein n=1 Tax=Cytobacillus massiliigabonensis TaxID=1871011 RepID=UPI000C85C76B|nr:zinc ribbon domain-containing protein [Cytobacillus massiliigabonensis]
MNCAGCGNELIDNDKFCMVCGKQVTEMEVAASLQPHIDMSMGDGAQQKQDQNKEKNESLEKVQKTAKNYWHFVIENLKAPVQKGLSHGNQDFLYGYINIFVLSFLYALGSYFQLKSTAGMFSFFASSVSFAETFFSVFIYAALASFVVVGVIFGILKWLLKVDVSFHQVLGRFGALITIPTALSVLYFILALPGLGKMTSFVSMLILSGLQIALILAFFSYRMQAKAKFDAIYGIFIAYAVFAIFIALTSGTFSKYFFGGLLNFGF